MAALKPRIFYDRQGNQVRWRMFAARGIYHATRDGTKPVCGSKIELDADPPKFTREDPSNSLMTCKNCADIVLCKAMEMER